jgi:gas vesicle protein
LEDYIVNKFFSFMAGALCGAVVGATAAILLAPSSGEELRSEVTSRWEEALAEARQAMEETRQDLQTQFEQMQQGTYTEPQE